MGFLERFAVNCNVKTVVQIVTTGWTGVIVRIGVGNELLDAIFMKRMAAWQDRQRVVLEIIIQADYAFPIAALRLVKR